VGGRTREPSPDADNALRLGRGQVDGRRENNVKPIAATRDATPADLNPHLFAPPHPDPHPGPPPSRGREHFRDVRDLWRRSGVGRTTLERLAAAGAFRSLGHDRRQALWEMLGLPKELPFPLFDVAAANAES